MKQSQPRLASYNLKGNIGSGAFSVVKLAQQIDTRQYCACKIVPKTIITNSKLGPRFELEIRILQQMNHPNIVALYDLLEDSQNYYVMMEFCPNGELFQYIIDHRFLKEEDAKKYMHQLISALAYIHRMKVAHRDLKPENLLIDKDGNIKISDFGFSRYVGENNLVTTSCGSPCYAAPECISGKPYDGLKSDIWSAGVILFAMVTGQLPWTKRNQKELFEQITKGEYKIPPYLTKECKDLIEGMMCVDPSKRLDEEGIMNHPWMKNFTAREMPKSSAIKMTMRRLDHVLGRECSVFYDFPKAGLSKSTRELGINSTLELSSAPERFNKRDDEPRREKSRREESRLPPLLGQKGVPDARDIVRAQRMAKHSGSVRGQAPVTRNRACSGAKSSLPLGRGRVATYRGSRLH